MEQLMTAKQLYDYLKHLESIYYSLSTRIAYGSDISDALKARIETLRDALGVSGKLATEGTNTFPKLTES